MPIKRRILEAFYEGYLGLIRGKTGAQSGGVAVIAPTRPGSLGDAALLAGFSQGLLTRGVTHLTILGDSDSEDWGGLPIEYSVVDVSSFLAYGGVMGLARFYAALRGLGELYLIGADNIDGYYGGDRVLRKLDLLTIASKAGCDSSIISFSFNSEPDHAVLDALRDLPQQIRLAVRDPVSQDRIEGFLSRKVVSSADLAFLLQADLTSSVDEFGSWVNSREEPSLPVVGVNINSTWLRKDKRLSEASLVRAFAKLLDGIDSISPISVALIPHDYRFSPSDASLCDQVLESLPLELRRRSTVLRLPSAGEVKAACGHLDFCITGRMHLAIAALGQGVPTFGVSYQGKFEGLFQLIGTPSNHAEVRDFVEQDYSAVIADRIGRRGDLAKAIKERLPKVLMLSQVNFATEPPEH